MGHEHCGAIKAAIDNVKLGNITAMLQKIIPASGMVNYSSERTSANNEFVHKVSERNVKNTVIEILSKSAILIEMEDQGEIKIVGVLYDMDNSKVSWVG